MKNFYLQHASYPRRSCALLYVNAVAVVSATQSSFVSWESKVIEFLIRKFLWG